jgi:hypothetical protein
MMYKTLPPEAPTDRATLRCWLVAQRDEQLTQYPNRAPRLRLDCRGAALKSRILSQEIPDLWEWDFHLKQQRHLTLAHWRCIHADQHTLSINNLIRLLDEMDKPCFRVFDTVTAIKYRGLYWPFDGHHRTWLQLALGACEVPMKVFDLDAYLRQKSRNLIAS